MSINFDELARKAEGIAGLPTGLPSNAYNAGEGEAQRMRRLMELSESMMSGGQLVESNTTTTTRPTSQPCRVPDSNRRLPDSRRVSPNGLSQTIAETLDILKRLSGVSSAYLNTGPSYIAERDKATGANWIARLGDTYDSAHELAKDIHEAYLVERKAAKGDSESMPGDPEDWLTEFKERLEGVMAGLDGTIRAYKKSQGDEESVSDEE